MRDIGTSWRIDVDHTRKDKGGKRATRRRSRLGYGGQGKYQISFWQFIFILFSVNERHEKIKKHFAGRVPIVCNGGISNLDDLKRFKVMYIIQVKILNFTVEVSIFFTQMH